MFIKTCSISILGLLIASELGAQPVSRIWSRVGPYTTGQTISFSDTVLLSGASFASSGYEDGRHFVAYYNRIGSLQGRVLLPDVLTSDAVHLVPTTDNGVYVVGQRQNGATNRFEVYVVRMSANRTIAWQGGHSFSGIQNGDRSVVRAAALGPNNSLFIAGEAVFNDPEEQAWAVLNLSSGGVPGISLMGGLGPGRIAGAQDLLVSPDGTLHIAGRSAAGNGFYQRRTPLSQVETSFESPNLGVFNSICANSFGWSVSGTGSTWQTLVARPNGAYSFIGSLAEPKHGGAKVMLVPGGTVRVGPTPDGDIVFSKDTVTSGSVFWTAWHRIFSVGATTHESFGDGASDAYGESYVLGSSGSNSQMTDAQLFIAKTNSAGGHRWTELWRPTPTGAQMPVKMAMHWTSGDFMVTGTSSIAIYRQAPVALADVYVMPMNTVGYVSPRTVTANDRFWFGSAASLVSGPSEGQLDFRANGTFTYTPPSGFVGNTSFVYRLTKSAVNSTTATVTLSVRAP